MKKVISILAACMLVFSFAGMVSAQDIPPAGECADAYVIDRGCWDGTEQQTCTSSPFDYEDFGLCPTGDGSYCPDGYTATKGNYHRAFIPVCDCIANVQDFEEPTAWSVYDVGMEILVDKGDGELVSMLDEDNGVYFAENIDDGNGIPVQPLADEVCDNSLPCTGPNSAFLGSYNYLLAESGTTTSATPVTGTAACTVPADQRIVAFEPDPTGRPTYDPATQVPATFGYTVTQADVDNSRSTWWVDIPELRTDDTITQSGWKVYVKVSVQEASATASGGLCSDCPKCEHLVEIGTLCCDSIQTETTCQDTLIYPYFPKTANFWYGMAITNVGSKDGTASVTMYENDGDMASGEIDVPANSSVVFGHADIFDELTVDASPDGTLGNSQSYFRVVTDFPASGFGMTADNSDGSNSMGYLPINEDCGNDCSLCQ